MDYQITATTVDGDTGTVTADITLPDVEKTFADYLTSLMQDGNLEGNITDADFMKSIVDSLDKAEKVTKNATITVKKLNDQWYVEPTQEFVDIFSGNTESISKAVEDQLKALQ